MYRSAVRKALVAVAASLFAATAANSQTARVVSPVGVELPKELIFEDATWIDGLGLVLFERGNPSVSVYRSGQNRQRQLNCSQRLAFLVGGGHNAILVDSAAKTMTSIDSSLSCVESERLPVSLTRILDVARTKNSVVVLGRYADGTIQVREFHTPGVENKPPEVVRLATTMAMRVMALYDGVFVVEARFPFKVVWRSPSDGEQDAAIADIPGIKGSRTYLLRSLRYGLHSDLLTIVDIFTGDRRTFVRRCSGKTVEELRLSPNVTPLRYDVSNQTLVGISLGSKREIIELPLERDRDDSCE